jgi:DNA-binding CsgD family transcriptional regulator
VLHELTRLGSAQAALHPMRRITDGRHRSWLLDVVTERSRLHADRDLRAATRLARSIAAKWPVAAAELHATVARWSNESDDQGSARAWLLASHLADPEPRRRPWTLRSVASPLTARETEVVEAVVGGATSREVAEAAGVSVRTVDNQLANVYRKLGVAGRRELAELVTAVPPS